MTTLVIGGSEFEIGRERTWWLRTRLGPGEEKNVPLPAAR